MDITESLLDLVGNTPILKLKSLDTGPCDLYVKLESNNPGGSIKDELDSLLLKKQKSQGN